MLSPTACAESNALAVPFLGKFYLYLSVFLHIFIFHLFCCGLTLGGSLTHHIDVLKYEEMRFEGKEREGGGGGDRGRGRRGGEGERESSDVIV